MRRRLIWAFIVALASSGFVLSPAGRVSACSCVSMTQLEWLAEAAVVVHGDTIGQRREDIDGREHIVWDFAVDERLRGDTTDVIEIVAMADAGSCGQPPLGELSGYLQLPAAMPDGRYALLFACAESRLRPSDVEVYFDRVPPTIGRGPPAAVAAFDARGHNAVVLDAEGRALRYLRGDERTVGLGVCPGSRRLVQVRGGGYALPAGAISLDMVVWDTDTWTPSDPIGIDRVDSLWRVRTACRTPDASTIEIELQGPTRRRVDVAEGEVVARTDLEPTDWAVYGDDAVDLSMNDFSNNLQVQATADPTTAPMEIVLPGGTPVRPTEIVSIVPVEGGVSMTLNRSDQYVELTVTPSSSEIGGAFTVVGAGLPVGVVFPTADVIAPSEAGPAPDALFERSGVRVSVDTSPPTTTLSVPGSAPVSAPASAPVSVPVSTAGNGERSWWPWIAIGSVVVVGLAAGLRRRGLAPSRR